MTKCCATCKWIDTDPYDHGLVCVNADSPYCAELWARPDDVCEMWELKECCANCVLMYEAHKTDYNKLGTDEDIDSKIDGYICMAFAFERVANLMIGSDPNTGMCEMYTERSADTWEEVIRCENCKWAEYNRRDELICKVHIHYYRVNENHYCEYGERRNDED